jgi:ATP-dependent Lon protease
MCAALISTLTNIPAKQNVAMTGEITLRGMVLPVGGVREKILAAHRAGIAKVLLPVENERDIEEIPGNVRKNMEFVLIEHARETLPHVLESLPVPAPAKIKRREKRGNSGANIGANSNAD